MKKYIIWSVVTAVALAMGIVSMYPLCIPAAASELPVWAIAPTAGFKVKNVTIYLKLEKENPAAGETIYARAMAVKEGKPLKAGLKLLLDGRALPSEALPDHYLFLISCQRSGTKKLQLVYGEGNEPPVIAGSIGITIGPRPAAPQEGYFPIGTWHATTWGKKKDESMVDHLSSVFAGLQAWGVNTTCSIWYGTDDKAIFKIGSEHGIKSILYVSEADDLGMAYYHDAMRFQPATNDIRIEGEDFLAAVGFQKLGAVEDETKSGLPRIWRNGYSALKSLSGQAVAHLWQEADPGKAGYYAEYVFTVKEEGTYRMLALMSAVSRWHVSSFAWQFDNGPVCMMDRTMAHGSSVTHDGSFTILDMSWHQLGFRYLKKGRHTLKIIVREKGLQGVYTQSIDQIALRKVAGKSNRTGKLVLDLIGDDLSPAGNLVVNIDDSPWHAVSDYNGKVVIDGVPVGRHQIRIYPVNDFDAYGGGTARRERAERFLGKRYGAVTIGLNIRPGRETAKKVILEKDYCSLEKAREVADKYASRFAAESGFMGYYIMDEPEADWADTLYIISKSLNYYDPGHGTFSALNHAHTAPTLVDKLDQKILMFDIYRQFKNSPVGDFGGFEAEIDNWRKIAGSRPFWVVLPAFAEGDMRWPTAAEARAMVYMSVARGAKGIFYFYLHPFLENREGFKAYLEAVVPINKKLQKMGTILTELCYSNCNIAFCSSGEVHTLSDAAGKRYLAVINKDMLAERRITVTVGASAAGGITQIYEIPDKRSVKFSSGSRGIEFDVTLLPGDGAFFRLDGE